MTDSEVEAMVWAQGALRASILVLKCRSLL